MIEKDFLIVGCGIAGACFAKLCLQNNLKFTIVSDKEKSATHTAAGAFNPVVLKKFTPVWEAEAHMKKLKKTFHEFEQLLEEKYIFNIPTYRVFSSKNEIITWQNKRESNPILNRFLSEKIIENSSENLNAPFGFGEVLETGFIDMNLLINDFEQKFKSNFLFHAFVYSELIKEGESWVYKGEKFKNIIFSEGIKIKHNPFFTEIKIIENKGETMIISTDDDLPKAIVKSRNFMMPIDENKYYIGATYSRDFIDDKPTKEGLEKLKRGLNHYFKGEYEILEHRAALRPTVIDRRPVIGRHKDFNNMFLLNGMGTRGTFNAPSMSKILFNFINKQTEIPREINIDRVYKKVYG